LDGISKPQDEANAAAAAVGPDGQPMDPNAMAAAGAQPGMPSIGSTPGALPGMPPLGMPPLSPGGDGAGGPGFQGLIPRSSLRNVLGHLRRTGESYGSQGSNFSQFSNPVNLLLNGGVPPTPKGVLSQDKSKSSIIPNLAGHNRKPGGKVDTNIPAQSKTTSVGSNVLNRTFSLQNRSK
jgi:hypothetical protein